MGCGDGRDGGGKWGGRCKWRARGVCAACSRGGVLGPDTCERRGGAGERKGVSAVRAAESGVGGGQAEGGRGGVGWRRGGSRA